ncbi:testis-specific serine kinase substrate isoform X4 [Pan paniscus]|uniref:testis-specific serine kinase substrate isoform X4 n=1 Tax=Pan paniscus TaxID=9597 RepID=UPI0030074394
MASVVVKTIWQSKEIHEAGDTPTGVESCSQLVPEAPRGVTSRAKGIPKKKKAVSFHGVEPQMSHQPMHWCLNLKRSSACTNVSLLNLAAMEPTDSTGTDSTVEDLSGQLTLAGPPASPTLPWDPDDADITEILSGVNSGLVRAKDSITSLKEKTNRVNQHVQSLQSECSVLSENLERRRQEAEELEGYCIQLKENCWKVTRSVEDAEIKTNVLKQNSALLEEKLRYVQQQLQDETPRRQEAELQEPEEKQKPEAGLSWNGLGPAAMSQGCPGPPGSPDKPPRPHGLVPAGWGMGPRASEGPYVSEQELQKLLTGIEELRVERSAVSVASLRSELEGLGPLKPILEEFGRQFQNSRRGPDLSMNLDRSHQGNCARCASQGSQLSTESLQQLLDRALTSLVDEVKQRGLTPACPSCQRLHKKILELERQALAKHVRAEALSSTLRLAQDEALRAKNLLLTDKMKPEEKMATLDHLHLKMCSLHDHLSNLPLEGSTGTMGGGSSAGTPPKQGGSAPEQ